MIRPEPRASATVLGQIRTRLDFHGRRDAGYSLVEMLVGMVIVAMVMAAVILGVLQMSRGAASSTVKLQQESSMLDVLNRANRQITYAAPLLYAAPSELAVQAVEGKTGSQVCMQYRYRLETEADTSISLVRYSHNAGAASGTATGASACAGLDGANIYLDPANTRKGLKDPGAYWADRKVVVTKMALPADQSLFTYYGADGGQMMPLQAGDPAGDRALTSCSVTRLPVAEAVPAGSELCAGQRVALVRMKLVAKADTARDKGLVTLETSASPRSAVAVDGTVGTVAGVCPTAVAVAAGTTAGTVKVTWNGLSGAPGYDVYFGSVVVSSVGPTTSTVTLNLTDINAKLTGAGGQAITSGRTYPVRVALLGAGTSATACTASYYPPSVATASLTAVTMPGTIPAQEKQPDGYTPPTNTAWTSTTQPYFSFTWTPTAGSFGYYLVGRPVTFTDSPVGALQALKSDGTFVGLGDASALIRADSCTTTCTATYRGTGTGNGASIWGETWQWQLITVPNNGSGDRVDSVNTVTAQPRAVPVQVDHQGNRTLVNGSADTVSGQTKDYYRNPLHWAASECSNAAFPALNGPCATNYRLVRSADGSANPDPVGAAMSSKFDYFFPGETVGSRSYTASDLAMVDDLYQESSAQSQLGTLYSYAVVAYNSAGNGPTGPTDTGLQAPPDVLNLTASAAFDGVNTANWTPSRRATSYGIYGAPRGSNDAPQIGTSSSAAYSEYSVAMASQREYSVVARNSVGSSPNSLDIHSQRSLAMATMRPVAPDLTVQALDSSATSVRLQWNRTSDTGGPGQFCNATSDCSEQVRVTDQDNNTYYNITYKKDTTSKDPDAVIEVKTPYKKDPVTSTIYSAWPGDGHSSATLTASQQLNHSYYYEVRAKNGSNLNGGWSDWRGATSVTATPPPPNTTPPPTTTPAKLGDFSLNVQVVDRDYILRDNFLVDYYDNVGYKPYPKVQVSWTASANASYYTWSKTGGPVNVRTTSLNTGPVDLAPNEKSLFTITAWTADGKTGKPVQQNVVAPPSTPQWVQVQQLCQANLNQAATRAQWKVQLNANLAPSRGWFSGTDIYRYERTRLGQDYLASTTLNYPSSSNRNYSEISGQLTKGGGAVQYSQVYWLVGNFYQAAADEKPTGKVYSYTRKFGITAGNDSTWVGSCPSSWGPVPMNQRNYPNSYPNVTAYTFQNP